MAASVGQWGRGGRGREPAQAGAFGEAGREAGELWSRKSAVLKCVWSRDAELSESGERSERKRGGQGPDPESTLTPATLGQ